MKIKKPIKYIILIVIAFFILKPLAITGYCSIYIPENKENSDLYFMRCLHYNSFLDIQSEYFLEMIDKIEDKNKSTAIKDYLYNANIEKGNISKANFYLNKWKQIDYKNGTFEYFGVQQQSNIYKLEKKNILYQEELINYKKYSSNKDISTIIERYGNWLSMHEKEKFYKEGLEFIKNFEKS